jgi:hypothetical protein
MHAAVTTLFGISEQTGRSLVSAGALHPPASLVRAQVSTRVTALGADGLTWQDYPADTPRIAGPAGRLLIEGQRTNLLRNPRAAGATAGVIGSGGAYPTFMTANRPGSVTLEIVGPAVEDGLPCLDLRVSGAGGDPGFEMFLDTGNAPAAFDQTWTLSLFARLLEGVVPPGLSLVLRMYETGGTIVSSGTSLQASISTNRIGGQRYSHTRTLNQAGTNTVIARLAISAVAVVGSWSLRLRVAAPQMELSAFASTPILPAIGSPAASTRGADFATASLASLGIGDNGACTILGTFVMPQLAGGSLSQELFDIDAGSIGNRFSLRLPAGGGSTIVLLPVAGGVSGGQQAVGGVAPGDLFRIGMAIDGLGRAAVSLNGAPAVAATGGPTSGLTTLRLGNNASNSAPMFGEAASLRVLPYALSDVALSGAVAALPA